MFFRSHFVVCLALAVSAYDVKKIAEQQGRVYVVLRNFGDNTRHHCMSAEIVYRAPTRWGVRLRSLKPGEHNLTCFDTTVNLSRSEGKELDVMSYKLGPNHHVQDRKLIYLSQNATCWILQDRNKTNYDSTQKLIVWVDVQSEAITVEPDALTYHLISVNCPPLTIYRKNFPAYSNAGIIYCAAPMSPAKQKELGEEMLQCQLLVSGSSVKEGVPSDCLKIYTEHCGTRTASSLISGCGEYPENRASCPPLEPQLPGC